MLEGDKIPHNRPLILPEDELAVLSVLRSGYIGQGPAVRKLEEQFEGYFGGGQACAVSSGSSALFMAIRALELPEGAKVAVPTYACSALLNAVYMASAEPVLFDLCPDTLGLNVEDVLSFQGRLDAIIVVHTFGASANVDRLKDRGVPIIEDCCQSLGSQSAGRQHGSIGDVAVFSFYATKIITGGHGGMVWSKEADIMARCLDFRNFDCRDSYRLRFNLQMTDIQAAMVSQQFMRLSDIKLRRQEMAQRFAENLPQYFYCPEQLLLKEVLPYRFISVGDSSFEREKLQNHFKEHNIGTIIPIERKELLHNYLKLDPISFVTAEKAADTFLSLPLFPSLTEKEVDRIVTCMKEFTR